jgi:hypothetical protein
MLASSLEQQGDQGDAKEQAQRKPDAVAHALVARDEQVGRITPVHVGNGWKCGSIRAIQFRFNVHERYSIPQSGKMKDESSARACGQRMLGEARRMEKPRAELNQAGRGCAMQTRTRRGWWV